MGFGRRIVFYTPLAVAGCICIGAAHPAQAQVKQTVLWTFSGGSDGSSPDTGVIADERGDLYGTTGFGGTFSAGCVGLGCGVVFKLTPPARDQIAWTETTLRSFSGGSDGSTPFGGLFARNQSPSSKKSLYGTTTFGGALDAPLCFGEGCGTVFKLTDGSLTTLWSFTGGSDGAFPVAALIGDESGVLYGTAQAGGTSGNGVVFKIDTIDQTLTTIYNFSGGNDGGVPQAPLLSDERGALYGTTAAGGTSGNGVAFKLTPPPRGQTAWTETTLWSFSGGSDGANPLTAGLIADETGHSTG